MNIFAQLMTGCTNLIHKFSLSKKPHEVTTKRKFGKPGISLTFAALPDSWFNMGRLSVSRARARHKYPLTMALYA